MSRNNNVRGPTSALTEFLREQGITARTVLQRRRTQDQQNADAEDNSNAAGSSSQAAATASSSAVAATTGDDDDMDVDESPRRPRGRKGKGKAKAGGNDSDDLDASEDDAPVAKKKKKLSKAAEAKLKAKAKANARKKGVEVSDDEDYEDEDEYTAPSKKTGAAAAGPPPVGSFENCADCEQQFTVTRYTMAARPGPGWLCHECTKALGLDPFKKPAAPRKRKAPTEKRKVVNFEEVEKAQSLSKLCIQVISKHIEDIEAFGDIGHINLDSIARVISKNRSLTAQNAPLFYDVKNTRLTFYDATKLESSALCTLASLNPNVEQLRLDLCGRIDNSAISHWSSHLKNLTRLELLGPFLIRPPAWIDFFRARGAQLQGFLITQSPRFDLDCVEALVEHCGTTLTELRLAEIGKMADEFLPHIAKCSNLVHLDLSYPDNSLNDDAVVELLAVVSPRLEYLSLSGNEALTDDVLERGIQAHTRTLRCLALCNLPELTDAGVAKLFSGWAPHAALEKIEMARCHGPASKALAALLKHSGPNLLELNINSWKDTDTDVLSRIAKSAPKLMRLNVGWCRGVDDFVIKSLLESPCGETLKEIKVYGCNRLTENCPRKVGVTIYGVEAHAAGPS
ncbi:RNI-like protein [Exidia glandulosa HHB12029]|uniref:RNI-like protein n=1 Tax=Exidia glandulosa HHB12029 TaxID=1314781 RepID=A0A166BCR3_EXIGL|nr:RNI-like protein [Exidia glandulosa HHB12029]